MSATVRRGRSRFAIRFKAGLADASGATYPMAMGPFTVGPKPPDVTTPTSRPSGVAIGVPSRAGALPSGFNPTRTRAGPSASSRRMRAAPGKPPSVRRRFWIVHVSPASTGEVVSSMSWPYRHSPASSRGRSA